MFSPRTLYSPRTKHGPRNTSWKLLLAPLLAALLAACGSPAGGGLPEVRSVTVTAPATTVTVGDTVRLDVDVDARGGASTAVTWSSNDESRATVTANGTVTGVAAGPVTVTATSVFDDSRSGSAQLTVVAAGDPGDDPDEEPVTVNCSAAQPLADDVTTDTVLPLDCYDVTRNVTVSAALTLQPGSRLRFSSSSGLRIADGGSLRAEGTSVNPIVLTSASGDPNDWRGVGIFTSSTNNVLRNVTIENAGQRFGVINGSNSTNLFVAENGRVAITRSTFRNSSGYGVYVDHASSELTAFADNTFDGNATAAMLLSSTQLGSIEAGNVFTENALPSARHIVVTNATLRETATWRAVDAAYRFTGNHFIDDVGAVITIEAGATLEFDGGGLRLNAGALRVLGDEGSPVTFTSASGDPNGWRGLGIASSSSQNLIRHAVITNAGMTFGVINNSRPTNLYLAPNSRAAITNSRFATSDGFGVYVEADSAVIAAFDDNAFDGNAGAPLRIFSNQLDAIGSGNVFSTNAPFGSRFVDVRDSTIRTSQTWQNLDVPYRFFGNHFIEDPEAVVSIEAGATLQFDASSGLRVNAGALSAIGTSADPITFTSASGAPGGWRGIGINSNHADNALQHVVVERAGNNFGVINNSRPTNLFVSTIGSVTVTNSAFRESSGWGIYLDGTITDANGTPIDPATQGDNTFAGNGSGNVGP